MVDYRELRLRNCLSESYRHVFYLLFWPCFGLVFTWLERGYPGARYHAVSCALDAWIPFNEWFLPAYLFWFLFVGGTVAYTFFFDVPAFRRTMRFILLTYGVTVVIYLLYPTCQNLRPTVFPRENLLTEWMRRFYRFDTNTNVCPSIHVLGSFAALFGCWNAKGLARLRLPLSIATLLICLSTVFLKQHSVVDVLAALPLVFIGWWAFFRPSAM